MSGSVSNIEDRRQTDTLVQVAALTLAAARVDAVLDLQITTALG